MNKTFVGLNLSSFSDNACPLDRLVIEYKHNDRQEFTIVSNNVSPAEEEYIIRGLLPSTSYTVRITAHNNAGSLSVTRRVTTVAEEGEPPPTRLPASSLYLMVVQLILVVGGGSLLVIATLYVSVRLIRWRRNSKFWAKCLKGFP